MITFSTAIKRLENQLKLIRYHCTRPVHLCDFQGILAIRTHNHSEKLHPFIFKLTAHDVSYGLTSDQWDNLTYSAMLYLQGHPSCKLLEVPPTQHPENPCGQSQSLNSKQSSKNASTPGRAPSLPCSLTPVSESASSAS